MIFEELRYKVSQMYLRRKAAGIKRLRMLHDFASAKHVGVLCAPDDEVNTAYLKDFLHYLSQKGIKYSVFGYFNNEKIPENFLYIKDTDFITRRDLNFLFIPKPQIARDFIVQTFDLLINCNIANHFPLEYISQLSVAKCKVGIMREGETGYDLMIDITKDQTIEYFLKNLEIYLSNLRNPK